ncbi:SDR family oxidoreductase [uncultured Aquimarina sp.]|uniref:SDR family oxidoreductase n=1 Tax=uncultured Aquimarina sp. TaxID=575652 RepID=UPI0026066A4E|nr:SDR family oxidoreductase [uncultured Aquimarina sp.]
MGKLSNKTAFITGGNSGIGLATAKLFLEEGAQVIIQGRNEEKLQEVVSELGGNTTYVVADLRRISDIRNIKEEISTRVDHLDILFLNAGVAYFAPIDHIDEEFFDSQFETNVKGVFFTIQELLPLTNNGSSIILNGSVNSFMARPMSSVYAATKAAIASFGITMAAELAPEGVRVNVVHPGPTQTPIFSKMGMPEEQLNQMASSIQNAVPMGRFGNPNEIAKAVLFFASDDSTFSTGSTIIADGGMGTIR